MSPRSIWRTSRRCACFEARRAALRSQVPLTALMVVYTFVSLSILAEPIVERRAPAQPLEFATTEVAVPADAVIPEPGSGRLLAVPAGTIARQKLTYRMLGSAFHDGSRMSVADLLYSTMFAYRWGAGGEGQRRDAVIAAATAVMRARLVGMRPLATDSSSKSIRFGDFEYTRELFVVEVYTSRSARRARTRRDRCAALERVALASAGADGGGGGARLGRVLASRGGAAKRPLARSRPLAGHERAAGRPRRAIRAKRISPRAPPFTGERRGRAPALGRARRLLQGARGTFWSPTVRIGSSAGRPRPSRSKHFAISAIRSASVLMMLMRFRAAVTSPRSNSSAMRLGFLGISNWS